MRLLILTAYTIIAMQCNAQVIRWSEGHPLSWEDFNGKINDTSKFDAECFAEIRYQYRFFNCNKFEFDVYANFDRSTSWRRKETESESLLKHEQMHFDIAQLFALKLKEDFEKCNYTSDYNSQILYLFEKRKQEYQAMQRQYDEETNHSLNKDKQKDWEEFVSGALRRPKSDLQYVETDKPVLKQGS